ncbi:MAG: chromate transporter [Clostridiaceae bacterium]|nr:chromate transporter [Clostridiaceae bacterium]
MKKDIRIFWKLFTSTFYLSAFTFGGGYVIVPLMKRRFVDDLHWIEEKEMLDLTAISQSSPGAIAVNASILIGYRVAGYLGSLVTILGTVLPPLIVISIISIFYTQYRDNGIVSALLKGMQAGVVAVIADVVINLGNTVVKEKQAISVIIMIGAFIATYFFKVNVIYIIVLCGVIGAVYAYIRAKSDRRKEKA